MARKHENRFAIEHQFAAEGQGNTLQLLFMQMQGMFEQFAGIDLDLHMWFINTAPWNIDFFLLSMPINFDATALAGAASEAAAITAMNAQADKADLEDQAALVLNSLALDASDEFANPRDAADSDDIRTSFDTILPFKIHAQLKCIVPVMNGGFDATGSQTFGRKRLRWNQAFDYTYKRSSVLCLFARQLLTTTDLNGPWDAAGTAGLSEADWRYLRKPVWRNADDDLTTAAIRVKIPWVIPRTDAFETNAVKVLNCVGKVSLYTSTNHPLAKTNL